MSYVFFFSNHPHQRFLDLQHQLERISVAEFLDYRFYYFHHAAKQQSPPSLSDLRSKILAFINVRAPYCQAPPSEKKTSFSSPPVLILDHRVLSHLTFEERYHLVMKLKDESHCMVLLCLEAPTEDASMQEYTKIGVDDFLYEGESARLCVWKLQRMWERYVVKRVLYHTRKSMEHFHYLSMYDELTGLYNMRHFQQCLKKDIRRSSVHNTSLALIMLDVDHLKLINDRISHLAGSKVLSRLGELIRQHIRHHDVAARFGGDEFVVILNHTRRDGVKKVALRLMQAISQTDFSMEGWTVKLSVSCGVAYFGEAGAPGMEGLFANIFKEGCFDEDRSLLKKADHFLYQAKGHGRSCLSFEGELIKPLDGEGVPLAPTRIVMNAK